jgi:hypothetical protein
MEEESLEVIYYGNSWRADLVKCLLEGQGINVFLQDETLGKLLPWYTAAGGAGAVKVLVAESEIEAARPIVDDFMKSEAKEFNRLAPRWAGVPYLNIGVVRYVIATVAVGVCLVLVVLRASNH